VDGFLMGMNDEGSFAASDEADVEWFVEHGGISNGMNADGPSNGLAGSAREDLKFVEKGKNQLRSPDVSFTFSSRLARPLRLAASI
jgi:hypothetical protein